MHPENSSHQHLIRGLGLVAAISIIIGNVIGTGVFLKARVMTCNVGSPGWVIAAWVAAGLLSLAGALTYAELTAMRPVASAQNVLLEEAYGKPWSFLFGWMQVLIARPGSQAAGAIAFSIGLNDFLGGELKADPRQHSGCRDDVGTHDLAGRRGDDNRDLYDPQLRLGRRHGPDRRGTDVR